MPRGDFPSAKQDQFVLRFPEGMRDHLKEAAKDNGRSMNAEIVSRLDMSFSDTSGFQTLVERLEAAVKTLETKA